VIEATGRSDKITLINTALDLAVAELSSQRDWSDLQVQAEATIALGAGSVSLASDVARVKEVRLLDGTLTRPVLLRSKTWVLERYPYPDNISPSRPVYGYLEGKTLHVVPWASVSYDVRYTYYRLHPALADDSSEILVRHAGPAVVAYANFWVFQSIEKAIDADRWLTSYWKLIASAKKVDSDNTAVVTNATQRGEELPARPDYWLDPFTKRMP
jgi:hypothetical protein